MYLHLLHTNEIVGVMCREMIMWRGGVVTVVVCATRWEGGNKILDPYTTRWILPTPSPGLDLTAYNMKQFQCGYVYDVY